MGKLLLWDFQQQAEGRAIESGSLLHIGDAKVLIEDWRRSYNTIRSHSSLDYRTAVPHNVFGGPALATAAGAGLD